MYHLGTKEEATHLLQNIADALALCIEGTGLGSEPCLAELGEQSPMRDTVRMEWEAVEARARTASSNADARVVVEQSPQLQVPPPGGDVSTRPHDGPTSVFTKIS